MRILLVIPTVIGGGAEQVAAILSREWSRSHEVRVIAWQASGDTLDFGVPVRFLGLGVQRGFVAKLGNVWRRVSAARGELRDFRPDVLMAFMDEAGMPCVAAAAMEHSLRRLVVSVHHNPQWIPLWRRLLLGAFYRFPGAVVAVSEGVAAELVSLLRIPVSRVRHIPNPLVMSEPAALPWAAGESGYVLAVGRLDRYTKGLDILLAAYAALPLPRPRLVIVGDGPDRQLVKDDIARLGLSAEVDMVGWVADPRPFYRNAKLFVLASRYEGWSNVLMEAMGEGCLVVATACPHGPAEVLGTDLGQWLVPKEDVQALSARMQEALSLGDEQRAEVSTALQTRVQNFAADKVAARWISLAEQLIEADKQGAIGSAT